jgi:hypothetical protein
MKHANPLQPIDLSLPFAVWGVDIIDILPRAPGGFMLLFIGIDTFTKRMEATPVGAFGPSDPTPPGGPPSMFSHWWWALSDLQL